MKLAPDVAAFIEYWSASRFGGRINGIDAEGLLTQLRALLRVVRAAQRVVRTAKRSGEWTLADAAAARALASLEKASRGRGENEGEREP